MPCFLTQIIRGADVFGAIVHPDRQGLPTPLNDLVQRPDHALGRKREVDLDAQTLILVTVFLISRLQAIHALPLPRH